MTPTPEQPDARELAAKMIADEFCDEAYYVSWEKLPERNRDFYRAHADAVLAAVTPVIRRQVAEEIALAIHDRFEHFKPEYHQAMIVVAEWCEDEARRHSTQPTEEETTNG